jgi:HEAT repeat protein
MEEEPAYMGRPLRQWILDLKDADSEIRQQAAYALSRMGPRIRSALPALQIAVKDPSTRQYAAEALGQTGQQALPILLELLESEESRYGAIRGLQRMQPDPFPELVKRLAEGEPRQRRAAAAAMYMAMNYMWRPSGDVLPALRRALKDPDALVRIEALDAMGGTRVNRWVAPEFVMELLKDKDPMVRFKASDVLLDSKSLLKTSEPVLEKLLSDSDGRVRVNVAKALVRFDLQVPAAMQVIREAMRDKNDAVCRQALTALGQIVDQHKEAARSALPDVIAFVGDHKKHSMRLVQQAVGTLSLLEPDAKDFVPLLQGVVRDGDSELSERAARIMAYSFSNDPLVNSMLPDSIKRAPIRIRLDATATLLTLKQRPETVVSGLVDLLQANDSHGRRSQAARILGEMGAEAKEAIPALHRALEDKSYSVRASALLALLQIEPDHIAELTRAAIGVSTSKFLPEVIRTLQTRATEVIPVVVQGLKHPDPQYRLRAGLLLFNLGPATQSVVPELRVALENKELAVRILAAITLARINPQTEGLVPILRDGLAFNDLAVREYVFSAIQQLGPTARELVPDLVRAVKDKSLGQLRRSAVFALQSTRPAAEEMEPLFAALVKDSDQQVRECRTPVP